MLKKLLKQRNKKGFTLIELIVVLVILAILVAAAAPAMMGDVNQAKKASYLANCRAVYVAGQADITAQLGTTGSVATTNMATNINKMVPEIAADKITVTGTTPATYTQDQYTVVVDITNQKITEVSFKFGSGNNDIVTVKPGDSTNVMD